MRPYSAIGVVIASTLGISLYGDGDRCARHLSRMPHTEPRPLLLCINPAVADTGLERFFLLRTVARTFCAPPLSSRRARIGHSVVSGPAGDVDGARTDAWFWRDAVHLLARRAGAPVGRLRSLHWSRLLLRRSGESCGLRTDLLRNFGRDRQVPEVRNDVGGAQMVAEQPC